MMALEDLRQQARSLLLNLANCVWPEEQVAVMAERVAALKEEIRQGYHDLLRRRRRLESLQQRIEEQEQKAAALPWQVQTYLQTGNRTAAWRAALELDRVRTNLEQDRNRRSHVEKAYQQQVAGLEKARERLGKMQLQLMRLQPGVRAI